MAHKGNDMTFEFIQVKNFAIQILQDAMSAPSAWFNEEGPVVSALKNLERNAGEKPVEYAKGMMWVVENARKLI